MEPKNTAYQAIVQISARAPVFGQPIITTPKAIESTPPTLGGVVAFGCKRRASGKWQAKARKRHEAQHPSSWSNVQFVLALDGHRFSIPGNLLCNDISQYNPTMRSDGAPLRHRVMSALCQKQQQTSTAFVR